MSKPDAPAFPYGVKVTKRDGYGGGEYVIDENEPGMTLRQYAAIHLRVPDSGEEWLDAMIERSRRDEFAKAAMQGILACFASYAGATEMKGRVKLAAEYADALLAEGKK